MPNKFTAKQKTRFLKDSSIESIIHDAQKYNKVILVSYNQLKTDQLQQIRKELRDKAVLYMAKNSLYKKAFHKLIKDIYKRNELTLLEQLFKEHIGLIFTDESIVDIRNILGRNISHVKAKAGDTSSVDVIIPSGGTRVNAAKLRYFRNVKINAVANNGLIDIPKNQLLLQKGKKITDAQVFVLELLDILPFSYEMKIVQIYENGVFYDPKLLEVAHLVTEQNVGKDEMARLSLIHSVASAFKDILALAGETGVTFKELYDYNASSRECLTIVHAPPVYYPYDEYAPYDHHLLFD
jgi:large subunit ribosomal protein LP0